ncbi:MAG: DUF4345 family protein [Pseudomonadota bacterium]
MVTRIFLGLVALSFFAFGFWSLTSPLQMTSQLGVNVSGPNGAFEMSGIYGGVSLGAGAMCLAGALLDRMGRPALWFLATYMGGYCFARPISWILHGAPRSDFHAFIAFEAAILAGAVALLVTRRGV